MADAYDDLEPYLAERDSGNPWRRGVYEADHGLLETLLTHVVREGASQASGRFAKAVDFWAAAELRRAGFDPDAVWPRATRPRVLTRELALLLDRYPADARAGLQSFLATHTRARALAPKDAKVLGGVYLKQADVLMAHWSRGAELLISTKTMLSSYEKNLRNRFEESYGDAVNLRGRHPLCALGFLFLVRADIPPGSLNFLTDMLTKLTGPVTGYDAVGLLVVDWDPNRPVTISREGVPPGLQVSRFLGTLTTTVLDRTPVYLHVAARERRVGHSLDIAEEPTGEEG